MTQKQRKFKIAKLIIDNGIVESPFTDDDLADIDIEDFFEIDAIKEPKFSQEEYLQCIQKLADSLDGYYGGFQDQEEFMFEIEIKDLPTDCGFEENNEYDLSRMHFYLIEDQWEVWELGLEYLVEREEESEQLNEMWDTWYEVNGEYFLTNSFHYEDEALEDYLKDLQAYEVFRYSGQEKDPNYSTFQYEHHKGFDQSYVDSIKEEVDEIPLAFSDDTKDQLLGSLELGIYVKHILDYVPRMLPNYDFDNHICDIHPKWKKIIDLLNRGSIEDFRQGLTFIQSLSDIDVAEDEDEYLKAYCMAEYIHKHYMNDPNSSYLTINDLTIDDSDVGDFESLYHFLGAFYKWEHWEIENIVKYYGGWDYRKWAKEIEQNMGIDEMFSADSYDDDGSQDKKAELAWLMWG
jgi:hypothetical protein